MKIGGAKKIMVSLAMGAAVGMGATLVFSKLPVVSQYAPFIGIATGFFAAGPVGAAGAVLGSGLVNLAGAGAGNVSAYNY